MKVDTKSRAERFAEKWLTDHGYTFECKSRCISKVVFLVRDGAGNEVKWSLSRDSRNMPSVMEMFQQLFDAHKEV